MKLQLFVSAIHVTYSCQLFVSAIRVSFSCQLFMSAFRVSFSTPMLGHFVLCLLGGIFISGNNNDDMS